MITRISMNPTPAWQELMAEAEKKGIGVDERQLEKECRVLYRRTGGNTLSYADIWNPDMDTGDEELFSIPITGTYDGPVRFNDGDFVRNVVGSSHDPNPYGGSWIGVLRLFYEILYPNEADNVLVCNMGMRAFDLQGADTGIDIINHVREYGDHRTVMYGGHVYNANADAREGRNGIYILPICPAHNRYGQNLFIVDCGVFQWGHVMRLQNVVVNKKRYENMGAQGMQPDVSRKHIDSI